jgi:hypothetical protein
LHVQRGPEARAPRGPRLVPAGGVAFALFTGPALGAMRACAPVLDINGRGLRIELATPLGVGTTLTDLLVVHRQHVVRQGEGVVTSASPVVLPDGRRVFECGVRLRASTGARPAHDPRP